MRPAGGLPALRESEGPGQDGNEKDSLEEKLGLCFRDRDLMDQALVHPSFLNELRPGQRPLGSYERLEFLGDAMLGMAITLELFDKFPDLPEGQLTKLRSSSSEVRPWRRSPGS